MYALAALVAVVVSLVCGCADAQVLFDLAQSISSNHTFGGPTGSNLTTDLTPIGIANATVKISEPSEGTLQVASTAPFLRGRLNNANCRLIFGALGRVDDAELQLTSSVHISAGDSLAFVVNGLFAVMISPRLFLWRVVLLANDNSSSTFEPYAEASRFINEIFTTPCDVANGSAFDVTVTGRPPLYSVRVTQHNFSTVTTTVDTTNSTRIPESLGFQIYGQYGTLFDIFALRVAKVGATTTAVVATAATTMSTSISAATATNTTASISSSASPPFVAPSAGPDVGLIAGAAGGAAAALLVIGGVVFLVWRSRKAAPPTAATSTPTARSTDPNYGAFPIDAPSTRNEYDVGNVPGMQTSDYAVLQLKKAPT